MGSRMEMTAILLACILLFSSFSWAGEKEEVTLAIRLLKTEMVLMKYQYDEKQTQLKVLEDRLKEITDKEKTPSSESSPESK